MKLRTEKNHTRNGKGKKVTRWRIWAPPGVKRKAVEKAMAKKGLRFINHGCKIDKHDPPPRVCHKFLIFGKAE